MNFSRQIDKANDNKWYLVKLYTTFYTLKSLLFLLLLFIPRMAGILECWIMEQMMIKE